MTVPSVLVALAADLHLRPGDPEAPERLETFLERAAGQAGTLYLLGDVFDFWVGRGMERWPFVAEILDVFRRAPLAIHFLPGNRDFLVGQALAQATGIVLEGEECRVPASGFPAWLLLHGDQLCIRDRAYARTRLLLRSRALVLATRLAPFFFKLWVAKVLRALSRRGLDQRPQGELAPAGEAVGVRLSHHRVDGLICGHTHRPGRFSLPGGEAQVLFVLPPWEVRGEWALLGPQGPERRDALGAALPWPEPVALSW